MPIGKAVGKFHIDAMRKAETYGIPDDLWHGKTVHRYNENHTISMSVPEMYRFEARINGFIVRFRPSTHELLTTMLLRGPHIWTTRGEMVDMLYGYRFDGGPLSAEGRISQMLLDMNKGGVPYEVYCSWGIRIANRYNG